MFSTDSNYLNMAFAVQTTFQNHTKDLEGRKALLNKIQQMDDCIVSIEYHQAQAETGSEGATQSKSMAVDEAVNLAMNLSKRALEYAKKKKDAVQIAQFKIVKSSLVNVQGVLTVSRLADLVNHLKKVSKELEEQDVSPEEIKTLEIASITFKKQLTAPREAIVNQKTHNEMVLDLMAELREIMISIDNLMTKFDGSEFLKEYQIARKVIDLGTRKSKGKKKDDNDEPKEKGGAPTEE